MSNARKDRRSFETSDNTEEKQGLSRRALLKNAAGAVIAASGAALGSAIGAHAQVQGSMAGGGGVPLRLPLGAMNNLDRKQYIHNMEIHSHLPGVGITGGEPLTNMWAKGAQRLLPGGGGFVDVSNGAKPEVLTQKAYEGGLSCVAYNKSMKKWIMMTSAATPLTAPNPTYPHGQYHPEYKAKSTGYGGLRGIRTYDITDPKRPNLLQEFNTGEKGSGTHMNYYDGGKYAYLDCGWDDQLRLESTERPYSNGLMIVDLSDPAKIKEVSRWWVPGQRIGEEEAYKRWTFAGDESSWTGCHGAPTVPKRVEDGGNIGYGGFGAFGMYVFDFTDIKKPKTFGRVSHELEALGGIPFHTCYPIVSDAAHPRLQNLLLGIFESLESDCREPFHTSYVIDVKDRANPKIIGLFPRPMPDPAAPYRDFCYARGRFSSHNVQAWVAPGAMRPEIVALSYFNAGIRIYDISNPTNPKEVAYFVPPRDGQMDQWESWRRGTSESVFVEWDRNLIWLATHEGTYCLSTPALGKPILEPKKVEKWSVPQINVGWDDQTAKAFYFGRSLSQMG
jgi:hypothetical protein